MRSRAHLSVLTGEASSGSSRAALHVCHAVDLIHESVRMVMQELVRSSTSPALLSIYSQVAPTLHDEAAETVAGTLPPRSSDRQALEAVDER